MNTTETIKLMLDALVRADRISGYPNNKEAIQAGKDWLERGREPVAMHEDWYDSNSCGHCGMVGGHASTCRHYKPTSPPYEATPLASQQSVKPWVGLTDEQIDRAIAELGLNYFADAANNRAVLRELCKRAAHGIKGDA